MAENTAAEGAEAVGMPQLDFSTFPNQIFWLVVTIVVIHLILTKVALPRISGVLSERQGKITNDIAYAEDLKKKAEEAEAAYEKALADARLKASEIAAEQKAAIQSQLDAETAKADEAIEAELQESEARITEVRAGALQAVKDVAKDAAAEIVKALGAKADGSAIAKAVDARVKG